MYIFIFICCFCIDCGPVRLDRTFIMNSVVNQPYGADILMEYVIKGNSAVLKCSIPSFVADFVRVEAWIDEEGTELLPNDNYG